MVGEHYRGYEAGLRKPGIWTMAHKKGSIWSYQTMGIEEITGRP